MTHQPGHTDNPYVNGRPNQGGSPGDTPASDRPGQAVVGGFAFQPRPGSGSDSLYGPGSYTPGAISNPFDPYRQGDMRRILGSLVNQGSILDLQEALVAAGLLSGSVTFGVIDSATESAFETLLSIANQNGLDWRDVLSQGAQSGAFATTDTDAIGGGGAGLAPSYITLPNREDLDASLEETGMSLTGQRLDDDLRSSAVESILDSLRTQQERQIQTDLNRTGAGPFVEHEAPDINRLLEEEVRERAPQKVMNKAARDAMDTWFAMIGEQA